MLTFNITKQLSEESMRENSGVLDRTSVTLMFTGRVSNRFNSYYFPGTRWAPEGRGCCSGSCYGILREEMERRNLTTPRPFIMRPLSPWRCGFEYGGQGAAVLQAF